MNQKVFSPPQSSILTNSKVAYSEWFKLFSDFPKVYRFTLGAKIDKYFLEFLESIFTAFYLPPTQKIVRLTTSISKLDGVKFFLQLAWENKCLSHKKYAILSEQLQEVGRMLGGWKRGLEKNTSTN